LDIKYLLLLGGESSSCVEEKAVFLTIAELLCLSAQSLAAAFAEDSGS